jgi:hypothetical protein
MGIGWPPFNGGDLLPDKYYHCYTAASYRGHIDVNRTGTTLCNAAAVFGTSSLQHISQHPQLGHIGLGFYRIYLPLEGKFVIRCSKKLSG